MRWVMYCLCVSLIVCAEDKKQPRPRQVQPHFVGSGRPKDQMTKKKSRSEKWFSSKFSCPECVYSIPELEPRIFSFNNPSGACQKCDGLGHITFFDPHKIVASPELSISDGAIKGWDKRNQYTYQMLISLAKHYKFDIEQPWAELTEEIQQKLLYGSHEELIQFNILNGIDGFKGSALDEQSHIPIGSLVAPFCAPNTKYYLSWLLVIKID